MGLFKTKEDYLKNLCINHPDVAHTKLVDGIPRNSFFRINNDEELIAATISHIDYPAVANVSLRGRITDKDNALVDIRHLFSNSWMFLQHVSQVALGVSDAVQECYDQTFMIMEDFIKAMKDDFETNGHCGVFENFDLNKINYVMIGPISQNEYGWQLFFDDQQKATRLL